MSPPVSPRLNPRATVFLVIDVQERLVAAMPERARDTAVARAARLLEGAAILEIPSIATEQYPRGLGPTVPTVRASAERAKAEIFEKIEFDACENERVRAHLERLFADGRTSVVLAGLEAHICVYQTARGLRARGFDVHVAIDAIASRDEANVDVARALYTALGATVTSTETVLFDLLGRAGSERFKAISALVR